MYRVILLYVIEMQNRTYIENTDLVTPNFSTTQNIDVCLKYYHDFHKVVKDFDCLYPCVHKVSFTRQIKDLNLTNSIDGIGPLDCSSIGQLSNGEFIFTNSNVIYIYFDKCYSSLNNQIGSFVITNIGEKTSQLKEIYYIEVSSWRSILVTNYGKFDNCLVSCYQMKDVCGINITNLDLELNMQVVWHSYMLISVGVGIIIIVLVGLCYLFYIIKQFKEPGQPQCQFPCVGLN